MKELILATSNSGKIKELIALLAPIPCIPQSEFGIKEVEETGLSFLENAILKARHASLFSSKPALADDSGLVVPALKGEPGIYSSRFAGKEATDQDNINLLLNKLEGMQESQRSAYFYCAMVILTHATDPTPIIATGKWMGTITEKQKGNQGFGYDPIFYINEYHCTAAQLSMKIKNSISHRAQALMQLISAGLR